MNFRSCFFFIVCCSLSLLTACTGGSVFEHSEVNRITVMTYNTQAFFDAIDDGSEFSEYRGFKNSWTEAKYLDRLDRLREVILLCGRDVGEGFDAGPDIVVLQEIENERVLRDLCNRLPQHCSYRTAAFIPPGKGSAFGSAVLSRYLLESLSAHSIEETGSPLRPLLQVKLRTGDSSLVVFAVHWKSKVGGDDTGSTRLLQEALLVERIRQLEISDNGIPFIVCGDFNQKRSEFTLMNAVPNCWDWWLPKVEAGLLPGPCGSYYYQNQWETIDNIFYSMSLADGKDLDFASFKVVAEAPLITVESVPYRYTMYNGKGYSDHVPLVMVLEKKS